MGASEPGYRIDYDHLAISSVSERETFPESMMQT